MNAGRTFADYLRDILDAIDKVAEFTQGDEFQEFAADAKTTFAVVRALEVIGEAAKHVPEAPRDRHSEVPWREMAGMRDKLTHEYFGINLQVVWRTIKNALPALRPLIAQMLADEEARERTEE